MGIGVVHAGIAAFLGAAGVAVVGFAAARVITALRQPPGHDAEITALKETSRDLATALDRAIGALSKVAIAAPAGILDDDAGALDHPLLREETRVMLQRDRSLTPRQIAYLKEHLTVALLLELLRDSGDDKLSLAVLERHARNEKLPEELRAVMREAIAQHDGVVTTTEINKILESNPATQSSDTVE